MGKGSENRIETPDWVKDAVFYQIFPDRFARSDRVTKPNNLQPWGSPPQAQGYQGGDLIGVLEHLDYLQDVGVTAIYFTPIFQSPSNHRYHTHDYEQVDPMLGGNQALRLLVEEAHQRDMRIVLDGVFNHASRGFLQFNDILEYGPHSAWLDWFIIEDWPLAPYDGSRPANYACWQGNRALPKFDTGNPQVREFIMRIAEYWISEYDIDGWRLDVPEEIESAGFWEEFRERVKALKPEAYIVGEIWRAAPEWLRGDRFDALMNYRFAEAIIAFAGGDRVSAALVENRGYEPYPAIDAAEFGRRIQWLLDLYGWDVTQVMLNLYDSHDTARLLSIVRGDKATIRLATFFQMTYPGAPSIYYGDEIGLAGTGAYDEPHRDEDARRAFPWHDRESWDTEMLAYFRKLIALRHQYRVLRHGRFDQLYADGTCYIFARHNEAHGETLIVGMNVGTGSQEIVIPIEKYFIDGIRLQTLFGEGHADVVEGGNVTLALPAREGLILSPHHRESETF